MAVRITPSGLQSYDPYEEWKARLKAAKTSSSAAAPAPTTTATTAKAPKTTEKSTPLEKPAVIRDQDTGKITGVKLPSGESYVGISEKEVSSLVNKYTGEPTPAGAMEAGELTKLRNLEEQLGLQGQGLSLEQLEQYARAEGLLQQQALTQSTEAGAMGMNQQGMNQQQDPEQSFLDELIWGPKDQNLLMGEVGIGGAGSVVAARVFTKGKILSLAKSLTVPFLAIGSGFLGGISGDLLNGGATERQGAVNTYGQMAGDVVEDVSMSLKTPNQAMADLDYLEQQITDREIELKEKQIAKAYLKVTGQLHDVQADLADAKNLVQSARNDVFTIQITDPDAIALAEFINRRRKYYGIKEKTIEEEFRAIREGF